MARPSPCRRPPAALVAATSLAVALAAAPVGAEPAGPPLPTSRTHVLRVRPRFAPGLEAGMPRASAYALAIALDAQERFDQAAARYRDAEVELGRMKTPPPGGPTVLEAWKRKARWQAYWSQQLGLRSRGYRVWGGAADADLGHGYYLKYLAVRAFTGQAPLPLALKARAHLETALRHEPDNAVARLTLATLLHETGDPLQAQREHARVTLNARQRGDASIALRLAAYHVAAGEPERALADLQRALQHPYVYRSLRELASWSNEFDRLRDDPRFQRLLTQDPVPPPRPYPFRRYP